MVCLVSHYDTEVGLGKKVLIANSVALAADAIFKLPPDDLSFPLAWLGALCYMIQIYFDFSGYSDMAIGLARLLGFHFHENFNQPYTAKSVTDFWRKWHISLSTWFRDYLYIPLGGNRSSKFKTYFNLMLVFILCGLWHGANWTFVFWGLWHGGFLVIERLGLEKFLSKKLILSRTFTLLVVIFGWVLFRASTVLSAFQYMKHMLFAPWTLGDSVFQMHLVMTPIVIFALIVGIFFSWTQLGFNLKNFLSARSASIYSCFLFLIFIVSMAQLTSTTFNPFIYFRF